MTPAFARRLLVSTGRIEALENCRETRNVTLGLEFKVHRPADLHEMLVCDGLRLKLIRWALGAGTGMP